MTVNIRNLTKDENERWVKALHRVCSDGWVPVLRSAYAHLMPFVDEDCPTAYTDCRFRIGLGPHLLDPEKTTLNQLATVILHETLHNTQKHRQRLYEKKGLDGKLCNFAADLEINGNIAQGVCGINLTRPCDPKNGHWEWLLGEFKQIDAEEAKNLNEAVDFQGSSIYPQKVDSGDWVYSGCLIPSHGQFLDFGVGGTAEQYLGLLEVEVEDMTIAEFMQRQQSQNQNDSASGGAGGNSGERNQGQSSSGNGNDADSSGADSSSGCGGDSVEGECNCSGGSDSCGGDCNGASSGASGASGSGSDAGNGGSDATGESDGGNGNSGSNGGGCCGSGCGHQGPTSKDIDGMSDGNGGTLHDTGDGHVATTHIFRKNADGTRTEVGRDSIVDDLGRHSDDEVWEAASRLGINPISRSEEQKVRDQIAHDIELERRSNRYGQGAGNLMLNYIERGLRPPIVDWKKMLRHSMTKACQEQTKGRADYTYRRTNRRYSQGEFIFPGMTSYTPTVRFALDTSGSMSAEEYYHAISEAEGILKASKAKLQFCCWDGSAGEVMQIRTIQEIKNNLTGGGGTLGSACFKQAAEEKPKERPDVIVCATDGCFSWQELAESLSVPELRNIVPIILVVYPFDEDTFYAKQGQLKDRQKLLQQYHKKAIVLQAWAKK